ncbi:MAG: glycosyltransferase [Desulfatibacillaceae bacterium]
MKANGLRADLHVHSRHSKRPSIWFLRKIGCPESFTEPLEIHRIARARGMDLVTITDHNTLAGSLEIAHLDNTFLSEEITTYFPEDGCKIHVLAWDITERQHEDFQQVRGNIYDLVDYLNGQGIRHAVAHPLFSVNDRIRFEHFEKILLLFRILELNGAHDHYQNSTLAEVVRGLKKEHIDHIADKYDIAPRPEKPWRKFVVCGSDDHSSVTIARSYTEVPDADCVDTFLDALGTRAVNTRWLHSGPKVMAHNLYSIAYQYYKHKFNLHRYVDEQMLLGFVEHVLLPSADREGPIGKSVGAPKVDSTVTQLFRPKREFLGDVIQRGAREIISMTPDMLEIVSGGAEPGTDCADPWYRLVNGISEKVLKESLDSMLENLAKGNFFDIFHTLGSAGSLYTMLGPYFIAYNVLTKDRGLCRECIKAFADTSIPSPRRRVNMAHFTDTLYDVNGVARTLQQQVEIARKNNKMLTMITCGPGNETPGVVHFESVGAFELPEYPLMKLHYPPLLEMVNYCHEQRFTHLHAATPGPIGLAALAIARILKLPIYGTYHTALPQYTATLTEAPDLADVAWKYMVWFYNNMDRVYVPSRATGEELAEKGVAKSKIRFYERGIDVERFRPEKRNGFFKSHGLSENEFKLLYVGRVSREKSLPLLVDVMDRVSRIRPDIRLVVVGDGPYLEEMREECRDLPVTFTGFLSGDELACAYASSDLFLFPSTTDTFGNAVLEAQASGVPVVVTDKGGPQENLIPDRTGFVVPAADADAFASVVLKVADDPDGLEKMRFHARGYMRENSFEATYMRLWESYRDTPGPADSARAV